MLLTVHDTCSVCFIAFFVTYLDYIIDTLFLFGNVIEHQVVSFYFKYLRVTKL